MAKIRDLFFNTFIDRQLTSTYYLNIYIYIYEKNKYTIEKYQLIKM